MKIIKYPDGTSYVDASESEQHLTFRVNSYEDLWHLTQIVDAFNSTSQIPTITIPNLIDAQADKKFGYRQSSGLKLVCKHLNSLKAKFKIFHPHNAEVVEALLDNVEIIDNSEFIKNVLDEHIGCKLNSISRDNPNLILMSTDAGGFKPLMKLADKLTWEGETYSSSKSRKYIDGKSKLIQLVDRENFKYKDVLLIDDICVNGGTFIGLAKMLKERNVGNLYLAISHLTVEKPNPEIFKLFDKVFTTDSKGFNYVVDSTGHDKLFGVKPDNLHIINLFGSDD